MTHNKFTQRHSGCNMKYSTVGQLFGVARRSDCRVFGLLRFACTVYASKGGWDLKRLGTIDMVYYFQHHPSKQLGHLTPLPLLLKFYFHIIFCGIFLIVGLKSVNFIHKFNLIWCNSIFSVIFPIHKVFRIV